MYFQNLFMVHLVLLAGELLVVVLFVILVHLFIRRIKLLPTITLTKFINLYFMMGLQINIDFWTRWLSNFCLISRVPRRKN